MTVIIVCIVYLVAMFAIGFYFKGRVNNTEDFYLSGRSLPWPVIMLTFAATWIGASSTMAKSGLAYEVGFSALTPTFATIFAFFIFSFISPRIKRIGDKYKITSIPDLIFKRFGKGPALLAAVIIAWTLVGTVGTQMVATSKILEIICSPWGISYEWALVISLFVVVIYTMMSGLYGVAYTDVVQGLILLASIGIALPLILLNKVGGFAGLHAALPADFFSLKPDTKLIGYSFVYLLYFLSGPPYWQRALASNSEKGARRGVVGANLIILGYSAMVTLIGVCAIVAYPSFPKGVSHENLIPLIAHDLFHPFFNAIIIAALLAVLMSTIDSYLVLAAQTIVSDIYRVIKVDVSEKKQLYLSKIAVVLLGVAALIFAYNVRVILDALVFAYTFFSASISIPVLAALFWKKATKEGILSGMIAGFGASVIWAKLLCNPFGIQEAIPGGILSLLSLVIVSLITYNKEKNVPFFQ